MTDEELKAYVKNLFPLPSREDAFHYTYEDRGEFIKTEILCRLEEGEKAKAEIDRLTAEKEKAEAVIAKIEKECGGYEPLSYGFSDAATDLKELIDSIRVIVRTKP